MNIELEDIGLRFSPKPPLFRNVSLTLGSGDFVLVQGPSGSGKSSLLRLLNRLEEPTSGRILIDGEKVEDRRTSALRRRMAYVQQTPVMVPGTVADNLMLPFTFKIARGKPTPSVVALRRWLDDFLLEEIGLEDEAAPLSVGQQQRLALIRTLLVEPEFFLCDEPTSALDPRSREIVEDWLERVHLESGAGVIVVTHLDFEPTKVVPRRFMLDGGTLREVAA